MLYDTSLFLQDDLHIGKKIAVSPVFLHQIGAVMEFSV